MNDMTQTTSTGADRSIGAILIDSGRLTAEAAERILKLQKDEGLRFGDAAIRLGLLSEIDIQQALSRQYGYPYLMPGDVHVSNEVVAAFKPFSPMVEQLRALRSQLMLRWFDNESGHKALAVLSPARTEGRSFIAANLAVVFSQLGERTLLIDADLRHPKQHRLFNLANKIGLSSLLAGRAEVKDAIKRIPGLIDLSVLPSGAVPPNPQELLGKPVFSALMANLQEHYDVVIVDTPAGIESADSQTVAVRARAALLVLRKDFSSAQEAQGLMAACQSAGVTVVGSVLNHP